MFSEQQKYLRPSATAIPHLGYFTPRAFGVRSIGLFLSHAAAKDIFCSKSG
jgi:hypothetical protein